MKRKGFTLIELLVVISIIGVLSSIVLASLGNAKAKAKDAAIRTGVNQLRNLIEISSDGDYSAWELTQSVGWIKTVTNCLDIPNVDARPICINIVNNSVFSTNNPSGILHIGTSAGWNYNSINLTEAAKRYSIMAYLPGKQMYYCIGSSGRNSVVSDPDWNNPGCWIDP